MKLLESFQKMDKETFETNVASEMTFTTVLSDQSEVMLTSRGSEAAVAYEDRMEWCLLVQSVRMNENKDQVKINRFNIWCNFVFASVSGNLPGERLKGLHIRGTKDFFFCLRSWY